MKYVRCTYVYLNGLKINVTTKRKNIDLILILYVEWSEEYIDFTVMNLFLLIFFIDFEYNEEYNVYMHYFIIVIYYVPINCTTQLYL